MRNISNYMVEWMGLNSVTLIFTKNNVKNPVQEVMIWMFKPTLPYIYVTISYLSEICFLVPTHPTFSDDVTLFTLFFFEVFPNNQSINQSGYNFTVK